MPNICAASLAETSKAIAECLIKAFISFLHSSKVFKRNAMSLLIHKARTERFNSKKCVASFGVACLGYVLRSMCAPRNIH